MEDVKLKIVLVLVNFKNFALPYGHSSEGRPAFQYKQPISNQ